MANRLLVDNNIVIPYLLTLPESDAARKLYKKFPQWITESFELIELSNVLMTYVRTDFMNLQDAEDALERAIELFGDSGFHTVGHKDSMRMAARFSTSAYDARYLVLAERFALKLVTQDKRLRARAPELTMSLDEALAQ